MSASKTSAACAARAEMGVEALEINRFLHPRSASLNRPAKTLKSGPCSA